ncbi:TVP38/TMEM64 family protein [Blastococcus sp. TF02-8]|uniref:TVP38/TMEM64 family protein n=1 Tax=Blastococcus sp. TF02-8 TaxID=2250574 RepID=UPI001413782E|nr:VTT domain-containing protein [Blastococcus sp. TF02-8]
MRRVGGMWLRAAVLGVLLLAGVVAALVLDLPDPDQLRAWVEGHGALGWVLLVLGLGLVLLAPVPRSVLAVLSGVVLGFTAGVVVSVLGGLLAGLVAFGLSRALGRSVVERLAGPRLHRVDQLFTERGFTSVLAVRMIPVMPHVVVSYGAGLSGVRLAPYAAATAVGLVPSTVVQVGVGASTGFVVEHLTTLTVVPAIVVGLVLVAGVIWWFRRRRAGAGVPDPG